MHEESDFAAQNMVSNDEDIGSRHIPRVNLNQDWFQPLSEDKRPATPKPAWYNVSRPLPLGGPPGQVTIQTEFFFNRDLDYLRFGNKGDRLVLSITKMKAAYYPDVGIEQMVPDQMWIKEECIDKYGMHMIMRFNKIHKFSDGALQQVDEALDYRVKEFRVNKVNPGLNTRFWTTNDVIKSKQFMFAIQKRLKLRRIFRNLESFVGGRIREGDYRLLQRTE
ncbi:hypothetical protein Tco_0707871 [Tanacetum coccineum]